MVHFNRGPALNFRQFQNFLKEINSEYCDLPHHINQKSGGLVVVSPGFAFINSKENEISLFDVEEKSLFFLIKRIKLKHFL